MNQIQEYLEYGFALVPIPEGEKGPTGNTGKGWNLRENVVTRNDQLARIRANVGLAHAYCSPSPTAALDVDDQAMAAEWLRERGRDLDLLLNAPDAVQIISGRANSSKLLYRLPLGVAPMTTLQIKDPKTNEMILEFRCACANGRTAQDVLPPSMHPKTGQQYQWGGSGNWRSLPIMKQSLLVIWEHERKLKAGRHSHEVGSRASAVIDDTPRRRATLAAMLTHISPDCSYDRYRNMVWAILSLGWADSHDIARTWCMGAPHRFQEGSFRALVAGHDEGLSPTFGTIHHFATEGGWHE